jgi:hypothetical protein
LNYNVTKTAPVLDDASQYYATVVKFDIPLDALPRTICPIIPNQSNPNLTPLQIGISYGGTNHLQSVIYVPQNMITAIPSQVGSLTQVITPYYFMYSFDQMIEMINTALGNAWAASGLADPTTIIGQAPYFVYNSVTSLFSLIVNNSFNSSDSSTRPQVICNYALFQFLDKFDVEALSPLSINTIFGFVVYGIVNESFAYNYYGITPPVAATPPFSGINPITEPYFYKITQDSVSVSSWNPIRKILFLSTNMPVNYEVSPGSNIYSTLNPSSGNNNGVFSSLNVLTDFTPQIEYPGDSSSVAYFAASGYGGYRLVDMVTNSPLYNINIKVVWQDIANNIYDVIINPYSQANIKLGFIRKSLYKHI